MQPVRRRSGPPVSQYRDSSQQLFSLAGASWCEPSGCFTAPAEPRPDVRNGMQSALGWGRRARGITQPYLTRFLQRMGES